MKARMMFLLFLAFSSPFVYAQEDELRPLPGWYVRMDAGFSSARDPEITIPEGPLPAELGDSLILGAGIGYSYVPGARADLTFTYRSGYEQITGFSGMPGGEADFHSLLTLFSFYLDLVTFQRISPYAGFGLGFARNNLGDITIRNLDGSLLGTVGGNDKTSFAWQLAGGLAIQVSNRVLLDAGYHYVSAGDYESEELLVFPDGSSVPGKDQGSLRAHEIWFSFQYVF